MVLMNRCLYILVFLFFSCDYERNNPIENEGAYAEQIVVNYGAVRDFIIIEDFSLENLHYNPFTHSCTELEQEDCYSFWCEWTEAGDYCSYKNRDIVALANDDKCLFIYELENGNIPTDLEHDYIEKIYERDLIEDVGDGRIALVSVDEAAPSIIRGTTKLADSCPACKFSYEDEETQLCPQCGATRPMVEI